jgi:hypothetical protein
VTDPNGRYYLVKNYHDEYPPALDFPFHVRYDSAAMPSGVCKLYSDDLEPIILKSTTPAVSTTQTTTPKQTTPPVRYTYEYENLGIHIYIYIYYYISLGYNK